jgi:hypothetical protein
MPSSARHSLSSSSGGALAGASAALSAASRSCDKGRQASKATTPPFSLPVSRRRNCPNVAGERPKPAQDFGGESAERDGGSGGGKAFTSSPHGLEEARAKAARIIQSSLSRPVRGERLGCNIRSLCNLPPSCLALCRASTSRRSDQSRHIRALTCVDGRDKLGHDAQRLYKAADLPYCERASVSPNGPAFGTEI